MTLPSPRTVPTSPVPLDGSAAEPDDRFRDVLAAEWLKHWSLRSTPWALLATALSVVLVNAGTAWDTSRHWTENNARDRLAFIRDGIPLQEAFTANAALILVLAAGAIGALAVTGEHTTGLVRTTFAAVPARRTVMAAKVCVVTAVMTVFGLAVSAVSFWVTQAILAGRGAGVSIDHPGARRVVVASALLAPVCALVGAGLGALLRHGAGAVASGFVLLQMLPLAVTDGRHWTAVLDHALPLPAWLRLVDVPYRPGETPYPWSTGGAWTVYALWAVAAAAVTVTVRRDA